MSRPVCADEAQLQRPDRQVAALPAPEDFTGAMASAQAALKSAEKTLGPDDPGLAVALNKLAQLYRDQGQYAQAEPLYTRALAIREKALGPDHPELASSLSNLAALYRAEGHFSRAQPLFARALAIKERALGPDHREVAASLNNLAGVYLDQARYVDAEPLYKRAVAILEMALGPDHPDVAAGLNNLARLYQDQGQYGIAEPLHARALAIREKVLGPDHPAVATSLDNLAGLYLDQGQFARAEPLYERALAIRERAFGAGHPEVAAGLNNLAVLYKTQGRYAEAEPRYERALAILEAALGPDHPEVATSLGNLAGLYRDQGQYARAQPLYERALAIRERTLGLEHPTVAANLNNLAQVYFDQFEYTKALALYRRTSAIYRRRIVAGGTGDAALRESERNQVGFFSHLELLAGNPGSEPRDRIADESLQVAQLAEASGTAAAVAKMATRFAQRNDALAALIKRKQDAADRVIREESRLLTAAGKPSQQRNALQEQQMRNDILLANTQIAAIEDELAHRFPEYHELMRSEPLSVDELRALVRPGEAMVVYAIGSDACAWVVRSDGATFLELPVTREDVAEKIAAARLQMEHDDDDQALAGVLFELYQGLFAPLERFLQGVHHVILVPSGPLQSLPFSMLVSGPPPPINALEDFRDVPWLARRYAFSVLPAVSSIYALRHFASRSPAHQPFIGFGDPAIGEETAGAQDKRGAIDVSEIFRDVAPGGNEDSRGTSQVAEIADVAVIRRQPPLPESADELRAIARVMKAGERSLWLREDATESNVRRLDLSDFRTLAFATHGVMSGQLRGVGEPGLLLTPPSQGTVQDDGYLSASEVTQLELHADWVILSACNTAAADGTPGAEGLSGLAKAFFYAGARSLLVSHWSVVSDATVLLTTKMLAEYRAHPEEGKAEAERKAMLALIDTPEHPEYAHPMYWAPFVVVGEGGASG